MFLKDLKQGDLLLSSGGEYRPFLFSSHSSTSKTTRFVQIHSTGSSLGDNAPIEATPNHLVFLHGKDAPIQAGRVKAGDLLVGTHGPRTVTKVLSVTHKGFNNAFTSDATLFVDGVLASSVMAINDGGDIHVNFGMFKVHGHTLISRFGAPLIHALCSRVNSFYCDAQVEDGSGGTLNQLVASVSAAQTLSQTSQALVFSFYSAFGAILLISYYLSLILVPGAIVVGVVNSFQYKVKKE